MVAINQSVLYVNDDSLVKDKIAGLNDITKDSFTSKVNDIIKKHTTVIYTGEYGQKLLKSRY